MALERVYLSLSPQDLGQLAETRRILGGSVPAFSATAQLSAAHPGEDSEGLEFEAMQAAAAATSGGSRVLVAAADLPAQNLTADVSGPGTVEVEGDIELARVVSFHLGDAGVAPEPEVETELSWYDVTEIDAVRAEIDG
ncbi:DUF6912 family protein [Dermacoccaceae bacterium W4C1]